MIVAVSGSAWMNGCATFGKLFDEKNTPDSTHIGIIVTFISPDTPSIVRARDAISSPMPPNANAAARHTTKSCTSDPRTGTPNNSAVLPSTTAISRIRKKKRENRNDAR